MKVAAIQMVSGLQVDTNLQRAADLVRLAAADGAQLVLLPEYFCLMGASETEKVRAAEADGDGPIQAALTAMARDNHIWLIGGTVPLRHPEAGKVWNSSLVFGPDGERMARYDKIHLFAFSHNGKDGKESYDEARTIGAGSTPVVAECGPIKVGLSICYDLRFPELYRQLAQYPGGLDLIVVPSAFTYVTGKAHWETLLKARAIENQCYVLAAGQGGVHENGRRTWGHSMLIDPWGEVVALVDQEGEGCAAGTIDSDRIKGVRSSLPALAHRVL
jgi:deaminated glutathione amidase